VCVLCQNGYIFSTSSGCIATTTTTTTTTIDPCVTQNYEKWSPTAIAAYQYTPSGAHCLALMAITANAKQLDQLLTQILDSGVV